MLLGAAVAASGDGRRRPRLVQRGRQPHDRRHDRAASCRAHVIADETPTDRLAQAFQTLVPDARPAAAPARAGARRRGGVAARQHRGLRDGLEPRRAEAAHVVLGRAVRLRRVRARAVGRAHAGDRGRAGQRRSARARSAPGSARSPRRALRSLDLTLLLDLLRIEEDDERWGELMTPVVGAASRICCSSATSSRRSQLLDVLVAGGGGRRHRTARRQHAMIAIDLLVAGLDDAAHRHAPGRRSTTRSSSASRRCACRSARCSCGRSPRRCRSRSAAAHARAADRHPDRVRRRSGGGRSSG